MLQVNPGTQAEQHSELHAGASPGTQTQDTSLVVLYEQVS